MSRGPRGELEGGLGAVTSSVTSPPLAFESEQGPEDRCELSHADHVRKGPHLIRVSVRVVLGLYVKAPT